MKTFTCIQRSWLVGLLLVTLSVAGVAQSSAAGQWEAAMETPSGQAASYLVTLKADGEKLTGTIKGSRGEFPLEGTLKGKDLRLSYTTNYNDNALLIIITGTLEGDAIKAVADIGNGGFQAPWLAKRVTGAAATTGAPPAQATPDVTGTWEATVESSQGTGNPTFMLKQSGEKVTGTYKGMLGEFPVTGTLKGDRIEFSFQARGPVEGTVTYAGTVAGKTMKGTAVLAGFGEGTFTANKK